MARDDSPYVYGDFWLDKRRDGKAPDIWQIAWYEANSRQVRYSSTRQRDLELAKGAIRAHEEEQRAKGPQRPEDAKVIPLLFNYWHEHGKKADSAAQIASSIRQFIGFLMQDDVTTDVTVSQLSGLVFERFREWRMAPHSYDVPWGGRDYKHSSKGVSGEAVSRNLDDIRAGLNHNTGDNARLPYVPKVPALDLRYRSQPRDLTFTTEQLGAILGYASHDIEAFRWIILMLSTAMRPEAALAFDPLRQFDPETATLDLHPPEWRRTKKINPIVPMIPELQPWIRHWMIAPHKPVTSRKTYWRTMRDALELPAAAVPKTIRHTVATRLRRKKVPKEEIETLLGHLVLKKTTRVYVKYDPDYLAAVKEPLSTIWADVWTSASQWLAVHSLSTAKRGQPLQIIKNGGIQGNMLVGADGLEPPTLSV